MKKQILTALLAVILVLLLCACGGEQPESNSTNPSMTLPVANLDDSLPALEDSMEDLPAASVPLADSMEELPYTVAPQDDTLEDLG